MILDITLPGLDRRRPQSLRLNAATIMAASQRPGKKMVSRCNPQTERGTLVLDISGYSLLKGLEEGKFIRSSTNSVGGHDWCIRFYPNGEATNEEGKGYVSVYLELMSMATDVMARFDLRLLDQTTGLSKVFINVKKPNVYNKSANSSWGNPKFMKSSELETLPYLKDDRLVIEVDITVVLGLPVSASKTTCEIEVPSSDLPDDLRKLLESEKRADVTFKVGHEVFHAHKFVLAMRSRVFEAELYGPMSEKERLNITVEDMQPAVFKALLHFIYTDSLPTMDDVAGEENNEMVKHLLVAADKYALERMKLMCQSILCQKLDVANVASTLALADKYYCSSLKDACIGFMSSLERMDDVVASEGYKHLKRACPDVLIDIWEKSSKFRKN